MKTGIIYFSNQGNTKAMAELLARKFGADTLEMTEDIRFEGFFGILRGMFRFMTGKFNLDAGILETVKKYDTILLGSPVWAGTVSPAVKKVLKLGDLKGKKVYMFTLQADPEYKGHDKRQAYLEKQLAANGAVFGGCFSLIGAAPNCGVLAKEKMEEQIKDITID